jgi:hypothetical protein
MLKKIVLFILWYFLILGPKGKSTIVTAIFGGLLQSEVNCLICGVESKKHDPFLGTVDTLFLMVISILSSV